MLKLLGGLHMGNPSRIVSVGYADESPFYLSLKQPNEKPEK